ncbi:MAG: hypothetical protein ACYS0D_06550 [Planctomycetota bacterium]|jgi:hypothetical protein
MGKALETVKTLNSVTRTILTIVILGALAGGGWWGYHTIETGQREAEALRQARDELEAQTRALAEKDRLMAAQRQELALKDEQIQTQAVEIERLGTDLEESKERVDQLTTAMHLLKVDQRLARLTVIDQGHDPDTGGQVTTVEWVELDEGGRPMDAPRTFAIAGDVVYVDNWVVKFDEQYVEQADELRSTTLVLFRRIFGERQQPTDGYVLDRVGVRPKVYSRGAPLSDFERGIWENFWQIANAPGQAAAQGIRAAHGEAVSMKLHPGRSYKIVLRASDGLSIVPEDEDRGSSF